MDTSRRYKISFTKKENAIRPNAKCPDKVAISIH